MKAAGTEAHKHGHLKEERQGEAGEGVRFNLQWWVDRGMATPNLAQNGSMAKRGHKGERMEGGTLPPYYGLSSNNCMQYAVAFENCIRYLFCLREGNVLHLRSSALWTKYNTALLTPAAVLPILQQANKYLYLRKRLLAPDKAMSHLPFRPLAPFPHKYVHAISFVLYFSSFYHTRGCFFDLRISLNCWKIVHKNKINASCFRTARKTIGNEKASPAHNIPNSLQGHTAY